MDRDGFYWHAGRGDDLLKVGGLWVSPAEIENVLLSHAAVHECAVIGARDQADFVKPKAFICVADVDCDEATLLPELMKLCVGALDAHKRPRWFEFIDALPRTATGKVQRFKLYDR